jgi:hypothetical protein
MIIKVWLENNMDGHSLLWALEHPGCFSNGKDATEALANFPAAFVDYQHWLAAHTEESWCRDITDFDVQLQETFNGYVVNDKFDLAVDGYEVNAWFRHDWLPLTRMDTRRASQVLKWSREDLLKLTMNLPAAVLDRTYEHERWSIRGALGHIATAERWYLENLDIAGGDLKELPDDIFKKLGVVRERLLNIIPEIEGMEKVVGSEGEFWSPRKMLRRAVWHELDHIDHIRKLLKK